MVNNLVLSPKHQQKLYPKAIQGLQVLALPITAMDQYLDHITLENPLIELDYQNENSDLNDQHLSSGAVETDLSGFNKKDNLMDMLAWGGGYKGNIPESETLHGYLRLQLLLSNLSTVEKNIGEEIIGNINDDGYFVGELCEIAFHYGQDVSVGQEVLKVIQTFSPQGVGSTTVEECLVLQVDPYVSNYDRIIHLINNHLEDVAERRMTKLSRKYGLKKEEIQEIVDYIRTLNPRPGSEFECNVSTNYIIPDIIVKKQESEFRIYINNEIQPVVNINHEYLRLLRNKWVEHSEKEYIRGKCKEARLLINSLEMRYETLKQLACFILEAQYPFFENGKKELQPLMMQQAADAMGVHVSTISRACQGKYIQTPWGTFPLKFFFSPSIKEPTGNMSVVQIKEMIQEIIEEENSLQPFSDLEIMEKLKERGILISRRTVAKYRQSMGIDGQNKRKRFS
jgi:RNA polymerase sigma-54 factor